MRCSETTLSAVTVRTQIPALRNVARASAARRYFKTGPGEYGSGDQFLGIPVPVLRQLARRYQKLALSQVSRLLSSPWHEERLLALLILVLQYAQAAPARRRALSPSASSDQQLGPGRQLRRAYHRSAPGRGGRVGPATLGGLRSDLGPTIAIMATFHYIKRREYRETLTLARLLLQDP